MRVPPGAQEDGFAVANALVVEIALMGNIELIVLVLFNVITYNVII
jgi:hypothetical protein